MVTAEVLATGSKGNAVIVGKSIMIDCGIAYKDVEAHVDALRLVLLTHIHTDHFLPSTIRRLANERPLLRFGACKWLIRPLVEAGVKKQQIDVLDLWQTYDYGLFKICPIPLVHDVPNCGYKIHFPGGKAIYATDTANLNGIEAKDYDLYLIEGNYGEEEIRQRIKEKLLNGQYVYEKRVINTHLSREQAADFIAKNCGARGQYVYLHTHAEG